VKVGALSVESAGMFFLLFGNALSVKLMLSTFNDFSHKAKSIRFPDLL
jgi:hypothetical protein